MLYPQRDIGVEPTTSMSLCLRFCSSGVRGSKRSVGVHPHNNCRGNPQTTPSQVAAELVARRFLPRSIFCLSQQAFKASKRIPDHVVSGIDPLRTLRTHSSLTGCPHTSQGFILIKHIKHRSDLQLCTATKRCARGRG